MSEHPPVYNSVPQTEEKEDAPPSYFNIMSQLRHAKENSTGPADTITSSVSIICGSVLFTVCLLIYSALPLTQLIIGVTNQDKCTIEPRIPLWLIVYGSVGLGYAVINAVSKLLDFIKKRKDPTAKNKSGLLLNCLAQLIGMFLFVWFIIGNVWVYGIGDQVQYNQLTDPATYCDKLVYLFAFWSITATWILIGLSCFCCCGILCITVAGFACFAAK